jgi:predicted RNA binding protein with dsRBD fold (UPF0201 family)
MENLVLQALGNSEVEKINRIKRNKEFLKRLINDLGQVYTLYVSNRDEQNSTKYSIKKQSNYIDTIFFTANENDCVFRTKILGYRKGARPEWNLGWIIEKYDTCKGDDSFMREDDAPHGHVEVEIRFTDVSANLMDIIKDITRIFDREQVSKRF